MLEIHLSGDILFEKPLLVFMTIVFTCSRTVTGQAILPTQLASFIEATQQNLASISSFFY